MDTAATRQESSSWVSCRIVKTGLRGKKSLDCRQLVASYASSGVAFWKWKIERRDEIIQYVKRKHIIGWSKCCSAYQHTKVDSKNWRTRRPCLRFEE